jgi:hypothetical protein
MAAMVHSFVTLKSERVPMAMLLRVIYSEHMESAEENGPTRGAG